MAIDLNTFAEGALAERFDTEFQRVLENIADPNTDPTKKRKITLTLTLSGTKKREVLDCIVQAKSTLAPTEEIGTKILMGQDATGEIVGQELSSGIKGQMFIDRDGDIANDIGEKIVSEETQNKPKTLEPSVVDFRKQQTN
ncbi:MULTISPECIES: replication terminator protein [Bacillus cereus group]|uniref:replication terminator protein n=1 Tax=Bacillus cereus group TaxID=86661 RepID=UPI001F5A0BA1|nr:replication terminator protein [Bacillus cereus group sp. BfR-BA-01522]